MGGSLGTFDNDFFCGFSQDTPYIERIRFRPTYPYLYVINTTRDNFANYRYSRQLNSRNKLRELQNFPCEVKLSSLVTETYYNQQDTIPTYCDTLGSKSIAVVQPVVSRTPLEIMGKQKEKNRDDASGAQKEKSSLSSSAHKVKHAHSPKATSSPSSSSSTSSKQKEVEEEEVSLFTPDKTPRITWRVSQLDTPENNALTAITAELEDEKMRHDELIKEFNNLKRENYRAMEAYNSKTELLKQNQARINTLVYDMEAVKKEICLMWN